MKRTVRFLGWAMLASLIVSAALVITAISMAGSMDHTMIRIDGEPMNLAQLDAGHWLLAVGGIALALLIVVLVVPLAVLIPLAIVAVALVGVLLVVAGVLAMLFSPLLLAIGVVWLMVRLIRRDRARERASNSPAAGATITG